MTKKSVQHLLVMSACPGSITARKVANELVANRLAACVQIISGVHSFFSWVGKVDNAEEELLLIKTRVACYEELEKQLQAMLPYDVPEIIAIPIHAGLPAYLSWIDDCTDSP